MNIENLLIICYHTLTYLSKSSKTFFHGLPIQMQSFLTKFKVNNYQKTVLAKHAGVDRNAYNWENLSCIIKE